MAINSKLRKIAENLLAEVPKTELNELIKVLHYFNNNCSEEHRSSCLKNGCNGNGTKIEEIQLREIAGERRDFVFEKLGNQTPLVSVSRPTCPCCGR